MKLPISALRLARPLAALVLALGLLGYAAPAASAAQRFGWLRLAHLSPNTPAVDVYLYSFGDSSAMIVLRHVGYGDVSPYERVPSGDYTVAMRLAGAVPESKPVLSTTVDVSPGAAYTVAGLGPLKGLRLQVMRDKLVAPRGKALVRVIQASLRQPKVTVAAGHQVLANRQAFGTVSQYQVVSPGTFTVRATGGTETATRKIRLRADSIHTIVVLDDPGHLSLTALEDAAGSAVLPAGGAATGFGGTAPQPGPSSQPWLVTVAAGLMLMLAGAAWLGRPRRAAARRR
jgi:hypothetical protein